MARVDRFGNLVEVARERRRERPIDRLPEPDPQGQRSGCPFAQLELADPRPPHANALTELLLSEPCPSSRSTQIRPENDRNPARFAISIELIVSSSCHTRIVAVASLPRLNSVPDQKTLRIEIPPIPAKRRLDETLGGDLAGHGSLSRSARAALDLSKTRCLALTPSQA